MLIFNLILMVCIIAGLYFSPSPEALIGIVAIVTLIAYGYGRYWRNPAN